MRARSLPTFITPLSRFALLAMLFFSDTAHAQVASNDAIPPAPASTVSCFDYYKFGSVQAKLTTPVAGTVSGANMTFSGTLENANPYPVVDGALYVKIFKSRGTTNDGNGPDVVDQFFVKENIAIPATGSVPISFQWRVPSYAQSGDYQLATFFTTSRKFNLLGLSFTDDVVGNTVPFQIVGEQAGGVSFDKPSVTVNDTPYHFAAFPPRASATEPVVLRAIVENTGGEAETAHMSWKVYQWDAQQEETLVQQETTSVAVPAHASAPVSITINDTKYPVYLVVGTLSWKDTKSIIGVRFVREGIDRTRINFPGVVSFPLKAGEENTLFSCLHNSNSADVPNGRLALTLSDKRGMTIAEYSYDGTVTSSMMGVASPFTPRKDYDYAVLAARLYRGDQLVDEARIVYDCEQIDPSSCSPPTGLAALFEKLGSTVSYVLAGLLALGIILAGAFAVRMRRNRRHSSPQTTNQP